VNLELVLEKISSSAIQKIYLLASLKEREVFSFDFCPDLPFCLWLFSELRQADQQHFLEVDENNNRRDSNFCLKMNDGVVLT